MQCKWLDGFLNFSLFKNMEILNIKELLSTTIVKVLIINGNLAKKISQNTRSRSQGKYIIPKCRNDYAKHSIIVELCKNLNELPKKVLNERKSYVKSK